MPPRFRCRSPKLLADCKKQKTPFSWFLQSCSLLSLPAQAIGTSFLSCLARLAFGDLSACAGLRTGNLVSLVLGRALCLAPPLVGSGSSFLLRKEVIQPHLPIRLPCYDFTPIIEPTFDCCPLAVSSQASGISNSHGVTGGVYKTRERIHRDILIRDY